MKSLLRYVEIEDLLYFRFISQKELDVLSQGEIITSPNFGYVHALPYHITNDTGLPLTIRQAVSFMLGTISTDYQLLLKDVQVIGTGVGNYANYLTIDELGNWEDIGFTEYHISSYSKNNIVGIFVGDFCNWQITRLDLEKIL